MFDAATEIEEIADDQARIDRAANQIIILGAAAREHRNDPRRDPLWLDVRRELVAVGGALATLLDEDLRDHDSRRMLSFDIRVNAPQRLDASVGSELWNMLSDYRMGKIRETSGYARQRQITAMLAMIVDDLIAIDDIDPSDAFDGQP